MKTFTFCTTLFILLFLPLFMNAQSGLSLEKQLHLKIKMLNLAFDLSNEVASGQRAYVFSPDSIQVFYSLDETQPEKIEKIGTMSLKWNSLYVTSLKFDYLDTDIPDEEYIYSVNSKVNKISEVNTNNFYTFSYNFNGDMTSMSYFSDGVQISGDSLDYKPSFSTYRRHYKYENGWKPYVFY